MAYLIFIALALLLLAVSFRTVEQGTVAVVTIFGKYQRILTPGLNLLIPLIETIHKRISVQNRSAELGFQAVTVDQVNVNFTAMLLFSVLDQQEETIKERGLQIC